MVINYGGFGGEFAFVFPLSPKHTLLIDSEEFDDKYSLTKKITVKHIDIATVSLFNKSTAQVAMNNVFAYNKETLLHFLKDGSAF